MDLSKFYRVQTLNDDVGINIGDPVEMKISGRQFIGEVKWLGIINTEKCVGLDMVGFISIFSSVF